MSDLSKPLPCVVQVGFAGSRELFESPPGDPVERESWDAKVVDRLREALRDARKQLNLGAHHFACGVSQIAVGGDQLFIRAGLEEKILQRILLPLAFDAS